MNPLANQIKDGIHRLIKTGEHLYQQGWSPATSSNYSQRLSDSDILLTASGKHKGQLTPDDFLVVSLDGEPRNSHPENKPSAETLLHCQLYQLHPTIDSVLHTHSVTATVISRYLDSQPALLLQGYELQKAFEGISTHETVTAIPIVNNHQDMRILKESIADAMKRYPHCPAYLIRGHGLYTWGRSLEKTLCHIEALEFLLQCEIQSIQLKNAQTQR